MKRRMIYVPRGAESLVKNSKENAAMAKSLFAADPTYKHQIVALWSGYRCVYCPGWYCA